MNVPHWVARAAVLFGTALGCSWLLTAALIRLLPRLGLVDYPSERKVHTHPTPRGGGLAVFLAVLLSPPWLGWDIYHMPAIVSRLQWLLAFLIVFVGLLDDQRPLSWKLRLAVQLAVCIAAVFVCLPPASWLARACAVLWIAMLVNAFNMLDNMDALSGGVAWIAAGFLAAASLPASADWERYIALMGALAGFLCFNWPPARVFLGDAGSTFLGFTLGLGSADMALRQPDPLEASLVPLCILAVPCYDLLSVVVLRIRQGRSPFHADKQHLSHRLVERGLSKRTAVRVIHLMALASGMSGLAFLQSGSLWIVGQLALWWIALAVMEFASKQKS